MVDAALPDRYNTKIALDLQKSVKQKDFSRPAYKNVLDDLAYIPIKKR